MKTDDLLLMAYVDGELAPDECREFEEHIRASAEAAEMVALLRASRLDYKRAFATQKLPPVPDSLTQKIEAMARAPSNKRAAQGSNDSSIPTPSVAPTAPVRSPPVRSRLRSVPTWLAAACVAGAFCGGLFLRLRAPLTTRSPGGGQGALAGGRNSL